MFNRYWYFSAFLAVIGSLILAFGHYWGFTDIIIAGTTGFIFASILFILNLGYETEKQKRERNENIKQALETIRGELELNLQKLGSNLANIDINKVQLAPDRLIKTSFIGISTSFFSLLSPKQQQIISKVYHKMDRIEMFSNYGVIFLASKSKESPFISQQILIEENALRKNIPECIRQIDEWISELCKKRKRPHKKKEHRSSKEKKDSSQISSKVKITLLTTFIIFGFALIAYVWWVDQELGFFHWWHIIVLVGLMLVGILILIFRRINRIVGYVTKYIAKIIGFDEEPIEIGNNVQREFFMASVPLYFITSGYLIQSAWRNSKLNLIDLLVFILGLLVLSFTLNLVIVAFYRKTNERWLAITRWIATRGGIIGSIIFAGELFTATGKLVNLHVNSNILWVFDIVGIIIIFSIMIFSVISSSADVKTKKHLVLLTEDKAIYY